MSSGPGSRARGVARGLVIVAAIVAVVVLSLSSLNLATSSARAATPPPSSTSACPKLQLPTPICHVFVMYLENQNESWVMKHAPFQMYLGNTYALAAQYYAIKHFSFPNYLAGTSGIAVNHIGNIKAKNVVDLIRNTTHGMTWDAYLEGMPTPCNRTTTPAYRVAHNPFAWYQDIYSNPSLCKPHDLNWSNFATAVSTGHVPNYAYFGPNSTHSCWKAGIVICDPWLKTFISPMVNSSYFNSTVMFITYDEGVTTDLSGANHTTGGGHIYTVAVSPYSCAHYASSLQYNHFDLLTTTEWLLGLGRTGLNDSWTLHPPMKDLFCFGNGSVGGGIVVGSPSSSGHLPALPAVPALARVRPT